MNVFSEELKVHIEMKKDKKCNRPVICGGVRSL